MIYPKYINNYYMSKTGSFYQIEMQYYLNFDFDSSQFTDNIVQKYTVHVSALSIIYNDNGLLELNANGTKLFGLSNEYYWYDGEEVTLLQTEYLANYFINNL